MRAATLRLVTSSALLLATWLLLHFRPASETLPPRQLLAEFPEVIGEWTLRSVAELRPREAAILQASDFLSRVYVDHDGRIVSLYIGYFETQRHGVTMHSPKNCLPGSGWEPLEAGRVEIDLGGSALTASRFVVQKESERLVVLYWYQAQGKSNAGEVAARLALVKSALMHNRSDGAIVRVASPVYGDLATTTVALESFVRDVYPLLDEYVPR